MPSGASIAGSSSADGCSTVLMAKAFRNSEVVGYESSAEA